MAGWYRKGLVPKDERVEGGNGSVPEWRDGTEKGRSLGEKREERREKREERETRTTTISRSMDVIGRNGSIPEGRDGREKGRPLGERREERKEKREERDKHNQDERAEEGNSSVPEW